MTLVIRLLAVRLLSVSVSWLIDLRLVAMHPLSVSVSVYWLIIFLISPGRRDQVDCSDLTN